MTKPLLSVVLPVHEPGQWLDDALASLETAGGVGLEVIVHDSTPNGPCRGAIERHADRLAIDYRWVPEIPSWTRKTNLGVALARADHVCTLHQDDLWLPGRLDGFADHLARYPDAIMFLSPSRIVDATGNDLGLWRVPVRPGRVDATHLRAALLVQNTIAIPAPIVCRVAWLAVGGLDEALWYTPDWDLWLKLAAHGAVAYDDHPRTAFRIHRGSLTMTGDRGELGDELERVLTRHLPDGWAESAICRASIRVNAILARAASGRPASVFGALGAILALGPRGAIRYLHASRLMERLVPRLRALFSGAF